ncbi:MAG: aminotransferase class V-fold PLP-dependent enzyme, partial [Oscillospiraceae bacterium]|nr:aminotransferase class V-fold PLP-dependent enzyme [Oscillospiraceae bacterium]
MTTPICDFVQQYARNNALRMHMPGHKGVNLLGFEKLDITEFDGADNLYEPNGIIAQSEANATAIFGCDTFYSTEGSSQCIRAMLYLVCMDAKAKGEKPLVAAGRNAHKTFLNAAALLDFDIVWLCGEKQNSYLSCNITAEYLEQFLNQTKPTTVYITSPDYLGNVADIKAIAEVCHKYGALLVVDNAHGAYLKFLPQSLHPIDLGADLCCDSAHKTLPVVTGGAYLHVSQDAAHLAKQAKNALAMFGSTSPSYIIMQSLDMANKYIAEGYCDSLCTFADKLVHIKHWLVQQGYTLVGSEALKITLSTKPYGYKGTDFAQLLLDKNIVCEFYDPDFVVLMFTPQISEEQIEYLCKTLAQIPEKTPIDEKPPRFSMPQKALSVRSAAFAVSEEVSVKDAQGRVLAASSVGCPPAVPIVMCGEIIDSAAVECFDY